MPKKDILITEDGLERLRDELKELLTVRRPEVINRIKGAKELGDLSENAEYSAAKEEQSFVEGRIQEIEEVIKHAKIASSGADCNGSVGIGCMVTVLVDGEEDKFELVGPTESDPSKGKISVDSPVGKALLGHKAKDTVSVETPDGKIQYKIVSVD
ncbi:MAG: Transcription elongation factor GreA [Berkelbacteria bacterium GW2011_GWA2_46_7]|uniref:Transcription elongation factor GreA n=1 Tax=Berkelbacteria bacterium GW2011_GWA2_46_7 TaxID=1618335 RepID=A0A0G1TF20_9BACT|nr:MAG: Transcription elongation factor GreA [Berkelbacteria bacterium GW2011_GWA2_46_7]